MKFGHPAYASVVIALRASGAASLKYPGMGELLFVYSVIGSSVLRLYARG
ncbi:hypothetical protein [Massilia sp. DWR3-1-1]